MCNRVQASFEFREIKRRWDLVNDLPQFKPIYNVSPGRKDADVLAIVRGDGGNEGRLMYWPLIPSHEKSMKLTYSTMNAKVERLRERYTWRRLLQKRRCIIPVNGFYEFVGEKGSKIPWFVYLKSKEPFVRMLPTLLFRRQTRELAVPNQLFYSGKERNQRSRSPQGKGKEPRIVRK
jgi:putative SOS response-associated peptidase YedK